jgi:uncharacterized protein (TIGR01777 family)
MKVAVTGATGLVGGALSRNLIQAGHQVVALARNPEKAKQKIPQVEAVAWNATSGISPDQALEGLDAVVHLAGESLAAGRWTSRRKRRIVESRVLGTRNLVEALSRCQSPPRVLVNASAIGYYGSSEDQVFEETSPAGEDFLAELCQQWESEATRATESGVRVVLLRSGFILSNEGGALPRMLPPFRMGLGGPLGSGKQWMSWIHIKDEVGAILYAIEKEGVEGPLNLTAPNPVTNADFTSALALALRRPAFFRVPGFVLRLILGEMAETLLLSGQRVVPSNLEKNGYRFRFSELSKALGDLLG